MNTPKPPKMPDPTKTAETQYQYNVKTGQSNQAMNMTDQNNPLGSRNYYVSGVDPVTGLPTYAVDNTYSADQQALLDTLEGTKGSVGSYGESLAGDVAGMYSEAPDFSTATGSRVSQMLDRQIPYAERFQAPARAQLDTQLRNQGILPNTPAYHQQMDKLLAQQDLNQGNFVNTAQGQAFNQSMAEYQAPADMISKLMGMGAPGQLSFDQTPQTSVGATDDAGAVKAKYDADYQAYQAAVQRQNSMMSGIMGVGGSILGGPLGGMAGSAIGNMFSPTIGPWQTTTTIGD